MDSNNWNWGKILNNVLIQPLTQGQISTNINFSEGLDITNPNEVGDEMYPISPYVSQFDFRQSIEEQMNELKAESSDDKFVSIYGKEKEHFEKLREQREAQAEREKEGVVAISKIKEEELDEEIEDQMAHFPHFFRKYRNRETIALIEIRKLQNKTIRYSQVFSGSPGEPQSPMCPESPSPLNLETITHKLSDYMHLQELLQHKLKYMCIAHSSEFDQGMKNIHQVVLDIEHLQTESNLQRHRLYDLK